MDQIAAFMKAVQDAFARAVKPMQDRIQALEQRAPQKGEPGQDGKDGMDGKDGASVELATVEQMVKAAVEAMPKPADGKSVTLEEMQPLISSLVKAAAEALPAPKDGKDVEPEVVQRMVEAAVAALPRAAAVDPAEIEAIVDVKVAKAIEAAPKPKPEPGARGQDGKDGRDGKDGKDADADQIKALVDDAVAALPKAKDGTNGTSVSMDDVRPVLDELVKTAVAAIPKPQDGRDGQEGEPGRDAAQIDILDGIDDGKSYSKGTFATHNGGMLRAFRKTDPLIEGRDLDKSGWQVIVSGFSVPDIALGADLRTVSVKTTMTDGRVVEKAFTVPVILDRGVFKLGAAYAAGDAVTWGGSMWIAQKATQDEPGTSDAWRLSVKRGRDGKDGKAPEAPKPREPVRLA